MYSLVFLYSECLLAMYGTAHSLDWRLGGISQFADISLALGYFQVYGFLRRRGQRRQGSMFVVANCSSIV
jgi:hypothetical protein